MKIAAIDPGVTSPAVATSWGTLERFRPPRSTGTGAERLVWLSDALGHATDGADVVAIEDYAHGDAMLQVAELIGVLRVCFWVRRVPVVFVPIQKVKILATGTGLAKKPDMLAAAIRRLGYEGSSEDEADALWLLEFARHGYGRPSVKLPYQHTRALTEGKGVVQWPELRKNPR